MMLLLIVNVLLHAGDVGVADTEGRVALLPLHSALTLRIEPFGGIALNGSDKIRDRHVTGQITQDMDVILCAVDRHGMAFVIGYYAVDVGMEGIVKESLVPFQTENDMHGELTK